MWWRCFYQYRHYYCRKFALEILPVSSSSMTSTTLEVIVLIGGPTELIHERVYWRTLRSCVCCVFRFSGAEVLWRSSNSTLMTTIRPFRYNEIVRLNPVFHRHSPRRPLGWYSRHHPTVLPLLFVPRMNSGKGTTVKLNGKWHESLQVLVSPFRACVQCSSLFSAKVTRSKISIQCSERLIIIESFVNAQHNRRKNCENS